MARSLLFLILVFLLTVSHKAAASGSCRLPGLLMPCNVQYWQPSVLNVLIHELTSSARTSVVLYHDKVQNAVIDTELSAYPAIPGNIPGVTACGILNCFSCCADSATSDDQDDPQEMTWHITPGATATSGHDSSGDDDGDGDKPPFSNYEKTITDDDPLAGQKREYLALLRRLFNAAIKHPVKISKALVQCNFLPTTSLMSWADSHLMKVPTAPKSFSIMEAENCDFYHWDSIFTILRTHHTEELFDLSPLINFFMLKGNDNQLNLIIQSIDTCSVITELPGMPVNRPKSVPAHDNTPEKTHPEPAGQIGLWQHN